MFPRRPLFFRQGEGSAKIKSPVLKGSSNGQLALPRPIADLVSPSSSSPPPIISSSKRHNSEMHFSSGISTLQNTRQNASEDRVIEHFDVNQTGICIFGVVDGHGGADCASFVAQQLPQMITVEASKIAGNMDSLLNESWGSVLEDSFRKVADKWDTEGAPTSGAVATLVLVSKRSCLIAHAGDCKVIASLPDDSYVELTRDHRCSDPDEAERVEEAGGIVFNGRVEGRLMPSRAFGDINVRTKANGDLLDCIAPEPDICYHHVEEDRDGFVIVASDGLFDVVPPARAVAHVRRSLEENGDPEYAAKRLVGLASKRSTDDISIVVLSFRRTK